MQQRKIKQTNSIKVPAEADEEADSNPEIKSKVFTSPRVIGMPQSSFQQSDVDNSPPKKCSCLQTPCLRLSPPPILSEKQLLKLKLLKICLLVFKSLMVTAYIAAGILTTKMKDVGIFKNTTIFT